MTPVTCGCGCGQPTRLSYQTRTDRGEVKGQPQRYVSGHGSRTGKVKPGHYLAKSVGGRRKRLAHVLIAERALGRPLPAGAQVHHVDGNSLNNSPSNLVICQDQAYHSLLHARQRVLAAGGNPNTQRLCKFCGELKFAHELVGGALHRRSNYCRPCHNNYKRGRRPVPASVPETTGAF